MVFKYIFIYSNIFLQSKYIVGQWLNETFNLIIINVCRHWISIIVYRICNNYVKKTAEIRRWIHGSVFCFEFSTQCLLCTLFLSSTSIVRDDWCVSTICWYHIVPVVFFLNLISCLYLGVLYFEWALF